MSRELHMRPVVETGATHGAVVHAKSGDADDVQGSVGGGAKPRDVAGVGRDFGFYQSDCDHAADGFAREKLTRRVSFCVIVVTPASLDYLQRVSLCNRYK